MFTFLLGFILISNFNYSQCVDFTVNTNACQNEILNIEVADLGNYYQWDFCEGDLSEMPTVTLKSNFSEIRDSRSLEIIYDSTNWYGFVVDRIANSLLRINFGPSMLNTSPTITDLGNIDNLLDVPESIKITYESGNWFGLVYSSGSNSILRLQFGSSLSGTPSASLILTSVGDVFTNLDYSISNDSLIVVLSNFNSANFTIVSLGSSINNTPAATDFFDFSGVSFPGDIKLFNQCENWYGVTVSVIGKKAYLLDFGSSLFSTPLIVEIGTTVFPENPRRISVAKDKNEYVILAVSNNGKLHRINLGSDLSSINAVYTDLGINGAMDRTESLALVKEESSWYGYSLNRSNGRLYQVKFQNDCNVNVTTSTTREPKQVYYTNPGSYNAGLVVYDATGQILDAISKNITVSSSVAPDIDFSKDNICRTSDITFSGINHSSATNPITSWLWDFGDGVSDFGMSLSHAYALSGTYQVKLTVESSNACNQIVYETITIYEEPIPDFTIPGGTICTNQQVNFMNDTPGEFDGLISYEWQVDGVTQSTEENFDFEFDAGGDKEIKLIASIPGCTVEIVKSLLDVREGAEPDFTFNDSCLGELVQFNNESVGSIVSYDWDFGNGITSTLENPALQFAEDGTFDVTLTTTNTDGCITSEVKAITVRPLPIVDFESELACENLATQLTDLTTIELDNLVEWEWNFGDGSAASTTENPIHTFETSGDYSVQLQVTSTSGCIDSRTKVVSVLPAPVASFDTDKVCLGVPINFTDQSESVEGESITSWAWNLGGEFSSVQDPEVIFDDALDYDVSLTVTSENLCTSTVSEILSITPVAEVEFVVDNNCENEVTLLTDATAITGDVITSYQWTLDEQVFSTNSIAQFPLNEAEEYEAALMVETEKGCEYVGSQIFTINEAPSADFTPSVTFGTPPLLVDFSNDSEGAISYWWDFQDGNTSNDLNPSNEFLDLGEYVIELIATNEVGCSDSVSQRISVLDPEINLSLTNLSFIESGLNSFLSLTVENTGSITLDSFYVVLDLGGELLVREVVESRISPNQTVTEQLDLGFQNRRLNYICATVESTIDIGESNLEDNEACLFLDDIQSVIGPAMPNPSTGLVSFSIVTSINSNIEVSIFDNQGKEISDYSIAKNAGNNLLSIDLSSQKRGLYMVSIRVNGSSNLYRIMVRD